MPNATEKNRNLDVWWGLLLGLAALLCNVIFFADPPMQQAIPWLSLLLGIVALLFLGRGIKRAFGKAPVHQVKILTSIGAASSLLLVSLVFITFFHARSVPAAAAAPRVGQRALDFTLADSNGQPVSFRQLFAPADHDPQGPAPKAVLLIFYRGYW